MGVEEAEEWKAELGGVEVVGEGAAVEERLLWEEDEEGVEVNGFRPLRVTVEVEAKEEALGEGAMVE